jgi:hypothetical protein
MRLAGGGEAERHGALQVTGRGDTARVAGTFRPRVERHRGSTS